MNQEARAELCYRTFRRGDGSCEGVSLCKRNGRPALIFGPAWTQAGDGFGNDLAELVEELCYDLLPSQRLIWLWLLDGWSIAEVAKEEGIRRSAVYSRIRGTNPKKLGGMAARNDYVAIWWSAREARHKHKSK